MPTQGSCRPWVSISTSLPSTVDGAHRVQDRAGRLDRETYDDVLPGRDAAENAAGVVRQEFDLAVAHPHLVAVLFAAEHHRPKPGADLDALDRIDRHKGAREIAVQLVVDRLAEPGRHAARDDLDNRAGRGAGLAHAFEIIGPADRGRRVGAPERVVLDRVPVPGGAVDRMRPDLHQGAADRHIAGPKPSSRPRRRRPARRSPAPRRGRRRDNRGCRISSSRCSRRDPAGTGRRCCGNRASAGRHCRSSAGPACRWSGPRTRRDRIFTSSGSRRCVV